MDGRIVEWGDGGWLWVVTQGCGRKSGGHGSGDIGSEYGAMSGGGSQTSPWSNPHCSSGEHVNLAIPSELWADVRENLGNVDIYLEGWFED